MLYNIGHINIAVDDKITVTSLAGTVAEVDHDVLQLLLLVDTVPDHAELVRAGASVLACGGGAAKIRGALKRLEALGFIELTQRHERRFNARMRDTIRSDRPFVSLEELTIAITSRCHYNCKFCNAQRRKTQGSELGVDTLRRLLLDASELGCCRVAFTGGEPLLHSRITEFVQAIHLAARDWGYAPFVIATAGGFDLHVIDLLAQIKTSVELQISMHGVGAVADQQFGVKGAFQKAIESLRKAIAAGIHCTINIVLTRGNESEACNVIKYLNGEACCRSPNFNGVRLAPCLPFGGGRNKMPLPFDVRRISSKAKAGRFGARFRVRSTYDMSADELHEDCVFCSAGLSSVFVDVDANVYPCGNWLFEPAGNCDQGMRFLLARSSVLTRFRTGIPISAHWPCLKCENRLWCTRNCPAIWKALSNSDISDPNPTCPRAIRMTCAR